jgi:hypothetical protein
MVSTTKPDPIAINALTLAITNKCMIGRTFIADILRRAFLSFNATAIVSCLQAHLVNLWGDITSSHDR